MKKDYKISMDRVYIDGEAYLEIAQNGKKIIIPFYKIPTTIAGIKYIKSFVEMENETNS